MPKHYPHQIWNFYYLVLAIFEIFRLIFPLTRYVVLPLKTIFQKIKQLIFSLSRHAVFRLIIILQKIKLYRFQKCFDDRLDARIKKSVGAANSQLLKAKFGILMKKHFLSQLWNYGSTE